MYGNSAKCSSSYIIKCIYAFKKVPHIFSSIKILLSMIYTLHTFQKSIFATFLKKRVDFPIRWQHQCFLVLDLRFSCLFCMHSEHSLPSQLCSNFFLRWHGFFSINFLERNYLVLKDIWLKYSKSKFNKTKIYRR